ncbi:ABC transporter substrate-binding protein [Leucobacter sp. UT-8R-CII-1-4]|uniref:ABC transporter substrate-binding protein n=1 Tax=Leucobacter sp. UT-8R-CII-1-4 TaxID=3040075 RepID=UPI0024A9F1C1|nr:ABC transporter substrate-binding protein [Leucobacter sp. UT-8R-CII-1-4]MDI6022070.1 ABC transporter substrate-binding protein [Leucobacter sp. UT-8R-CII-1-4]
MTESNTSAPAEAPEYRKRGRSNKPLFVTLAIVVAAAVITALVFWLGNRSSDTQVPPTNGTTKQIVVGLQLEPSNLDIRTTGGVALDQILVDNVYQGLIGLQSGTVDTYVPVLAESMPEQSDDGLSYTFTLRKGVKFASGNELTADDVVDSLSAAEGPASLSTALGAPVTVTAPDALTVEVTLSAPNSQLLWHLANRPGLVFETAFEGDLASTSNGTGPFVVKQWKQGDSITFDTNANYWGKKPAVDSVVWRYIPDGNAAVNAALEGDLDVLAPVLSNMVSQFEGSDFKIEHAASTDVFTLGFNTKKAPLDDPRVRQALSMAIDGDSMVAAFYGDGKPLGGPITDLEPAYEDLNSVHPYDPEAAKALLAEAGVENLELSVTIPNFYGTDAINQVVTQFAAVGVKLNVNSVEFGTWLSDVYSAPEDGSIRDFDLSYVNHAEPNDFVNYANPDYYFGYNNPKVQELYAQSIAATDPSEAVKLVKEAAKIVSEDAPAKWLINYTPANAIAKHVQGFPTSNTNSRINLADVSV